MSSFVKNAWYVAAWSGEIGRYPMARTILGENLVFWRRQDGSPAALIDRCPHKLAPLSAGSLVGDDLQCGYHGMTFNSHGQCVRIPGQIAIPPSACARPFPLLERFGAVWVWMGEPALADASQIVEVRRYGEPGWGLVDGQYLHFDCNYLNITDNLVDPAHTTYVHRNTIGNAAAEDVSVKVEQGENHVLAYRWVNDSEPVPLVKAMGNFAGQVDRWQYYYLHLPSVSCVDFGSIAANREHSEQEMDAGLRSFSYNFLTPETETTTHYFWLHLRNYQPDSTQASAQVTQLMTDTFLEDAAILALVQREQDRTGIREFVRLGIDNAPARIRRLIARRQEAEQQMAQEAVSTAPPSSSQALTA
ncbi:aromatic ring-hydroxylating dioxygenase subunit alpha [Comamonas sp. lk]|uniref:aromatic ring-hydroxylating dioxygenase subunit alpha n=1 Tax=Comamonas sp. lk TaxID=2201272 RepID=UPI000EAB50F8|nr:aromatic ring-hydroxylating dioxygenase subunit alpha [Comamonas sp. lk]